MALCMYSTPKIAIWKDEDYLIAQSYAKHSIPIMITTRKMTTVALGVLTAAAVVATYTLGTAVILANLSTALAIAGIMITLLAYRMLLSRAIHDKNPATHVPELDHIYKTLGGCTWEYNASKKELFIGKDSFNEDPASRVSLILKAERYGIFVKFKNQSIEAATNPQFNEAMQVKRLQSKLESAAEALLLAGLTQQLPIERINACQRYLCVTLRRNRSEYVQPPFYHLLDKDTLLIRSAAGQHEINVHISSRFKNILHVDTDSLRIAKGNIPLEDPVVEEFRTKYDKGSWTQVNWKAQ